MVGRPRKPQLAQRVIIRTGLLHLQRMQITPQGVRLKPAAERSPVKGWQGGKLIPFIRPALSFILGQIHAHTRFQRLRSGVALRGPAGLRHKQRVLKRVIIISPAMAVPLRRRLAQTAAMRRIVDIGNIGTQFFHQDGCVDSRKRFPEKALLVLLPAPFIPALLLLISTADQADAGMGADGL